MGMPSEPHHDEYVLSLVSISRMAFAGATKWEMGSILACRARGNLGYGCLGR